MKIVLMVFLGASLAGCSSSKQFLTSERQDDKTCRSFMRNKEPADDTTYQECRQTLVDIANSPGSVSPPSNVTIIVNQ